MVVDTGFTSHELSAITIALDFLIEDLQEDMKVIPFNEKEKYSKTIMVARDTKNNFSERKDNASYKQVLLTISALRSLTDIIAEDLKVCTNPKERDNSLELQKYAFSAIRKLNLVKETIEKRFE